MNQFEEHVKSGAFQLSLSKRMIKVLLSMTGNGKEDDRLNLAPYQALQRRGLIEWNEEGPFVTQAGKLVSELLIIAKY